MRIDDRSNEWGVEFAKILKSYETHEKIGAVQGEVAQITPDFIISILDGEVILNSKIHDIFVSKRNRGESNLVDSLMVGDLVLVIADESDSIFYILDRVEKVR